MATAASRERLARIPASVSHVHLIGVGGSAMAALAGMLAELAGWGRVTLGADKGYDQKGFVRGLRDHQVTPHVARKGHSAIDGRTTRHPGYARSQTKRKRVEEIFGGLKPIGGLRKTPHRGADRVGGVFTFAAAAYHLVRMRNLLPAGT